MARITQQMLLPPIGAPRSHPTAANTSSRQQRYTVMLSPDPVVAYFSMEIALEPDFPTYSGGLGILAGDTLRAAADLGVPLVGVSLVHRLGYFRQHLDSDGNQTESPDP